MNLANQEVRAYTKEMQTHSKRIKPTQKMMGSISPKVRAEVKLRSKGICERCKSAYGVHMAHLVRRPQMTHRTTVNDLVHLCIQCHVWADTTAEGRIWLKEFKDHLNGSR